MTIFDFTAVLGGSFAYTCKRSGPKIEHRRTSTLTLLTLQHVPDPSGNERLSEIQSLKSYTLNYIRTLLANEDVKTHAVEGLGRIAERTNRELPSRPRHPTSGLQTQGWCLLTP